MLDAGAKFFGLRSMPVDESWLNLIAVDELRCVISRWPTQRPKTNWKLQTTLFNSFGPGSLTVNDFFTWCTNEVLLHQRMNLLTNMGLMSLFAIATCLNYVTGQSLAQTMLPFTFFDSPGICPLVLPR